MMKIFTTLGLLLGISWLAVAEPAKFSFVPNQRQWPEQVRYATRLPGGQLFFEDSRFTYTLVAGSPEQHFDDAARSLAGHAFRMQLVGARARPVVVGEEPQPGYENYFLGNDPARWATQVPQFGQLRYRQVYAGIDMRWHSAAAQLEYDFEVAPGTNPAVIRMRYEGLDQVSLYDGQLRLRTSLGTQTEQAPVAYQLNAATGQREPVACRFRQLSATEVGFELTGAYDHSRMLIIDPSLVFCTYSGSNGMSANCAASDAQGNVYSAGMVLSTPYPTTVGAFQTQGKEGNVGIAKFSPDGRQLPYSTYLGGKSSLGYSEYPLKLVVNASGEMVLLGVTSSNDFPVTATAFQRLLAGGQDMFITRFAANGAALLGSTYLGGTGMEGGNLSNIPAALTFDGNGNILVGCATTSGNFPVRAALQSTNPSGSGGFGIESSGFLSKLNPTLSTLLWSTYLGGAGSDQVHDVRVAANGSLYVCGQTTSANFPTSATALNRTLGGQLDGFVLNLDANGQLLLASTYLGTANNESARFLDFDSQQRVCVAGINQGSSYPITSGTISSLRPGSDMVFLHCLNANLSSTAFSTGFSTSSGSFFGRTTMTGLTAFAVTECDQLAFSAYSTPNQNLPVTPDAFSSAFRGIYLCVLNPGARSLVYGSYFGSSTSDNTHLHPAAASQITRSGILTHIECSLAFDYPTSAGVYAPRKLAGSNDGAIFKYNVLGALIFEFRAGLAAVPTACAPSSVTFSNTSLGAKTFQWNFGDGSPADTARNPTHVFSQAGTYTVRLIALRPPQACGPTRDTARTTVIVRAVPPDIEQTVILDCENELTLDAGVAAPGYEWSTGEKTRTIARISKPGRYRVQILDPSSCPYFVNFDVKPAPLAKLPPNIITPNDDRLNETFMLPPIMAGSGLKVFNRWGTLVYQSPAYTNDWRAGSLPTGTYFYEVRSPSACVGVVKGWLQVTR